LEVEALIPDAGHTVRNSSTGNDALQHQCSALPFLGAFQVIIERVIHL
jgi:hypothetical protein